uniref:Succinate dehydrogenase assembly factor 4, mitochondrial n=1 Tax=Anopheles marajoara TaxID=58244 RepID=A0A2M4C412_9DIPT
MTSKVLLNKFSSSMRHVYVVNIVPSLSFCSTNKPPTDNKPVSPRMEEFQKKLREKTPIGKLDEIVGKHPYQEKEPLQAWPNNTNPNTGEIGGPRGPEPTRYGDWERKGRVTDF